MSTLPNLVEVRALTLPEPAGDLRFFARQPILDLHGRVHGYELLFRSGPEAEFRGDRGMATSTMIDNTVVFGLESLTQKLPAFVNCTASSLTGHDVGALPPGMTVLEILEDAEPLPSLVEACRRFKNEGYRLALDDFIYRESLEPLIRIVDYIKIDYLDTTARQRQEILSRLGGFRGALVAEKVETQQEYSLARAEGFALFQGYYFCRPSLLVKHKIPANKAVHFRLLQMLDEYPLNLNRVSEALKQEPSLTYRLLRLVNSPASAVRQEVRSIRMALLAVGDDIFRRIAILAIVSELNSGRPDEVLRMALIRARFCELSSCLSSLDATEQYLLGLFSLLPAMLQVPMQDAIAEMPLRDAVRDALLGKAAPLRSALEWIEAHEQGDWQSCGATLRLNGLDGAQLHAFYMESMAWADEILSGGV